jgi:integrating conjugative element protein (TIGR03765 family)
MDKNIITKTLSFSFLVATFSVFADSSQYTYSQYTKNMTVLEDRGGQSISKYIPKNNDAMVQMNKVRLERKNTSMHNATFPVVSKSLSVGRVTLNEANDLKYQMSSQPLFIIGYDPVSINWLKANKKLLSDNHAVGLVVNIETVEQMNQLQQIAGNGVLMQPTAGDSLAEHLKIKHYPFYMDNKGVLR